MERRKQSLGRSSVEKKVDRGRESREGRREREPRGIWVGVCQVMMVVVVWNVWLLRRGSRGTAILRSKLDNKCIDQDPSLAAVAARRRSAEAAGRSTLAAALDRGLGTGLAAAAGSSPAAFRERRSGTSADPCPLLRPADLGSTPAAGTAVVARTAGCTPSFGMRAIPVSGQEKPSPVKVSSSESARRCSVIRHLRETPRTSRQD